MMSANLEKLTTAFATASNIDIQIVQDDLAYNTIPQWDSTAHMALIAELEDIFDIMLDTDDIIDMSSVAKAKEIIQKYGVSL